MPWTAVQEVKRRFPNPSPQDTEQSSAPKSLGADKVHHSPRINSFVLQSAKPRFNISQYTADHWQSRNKAPSPFLLFTLYRAQ